MVPNVKIMHDVNDQGAPPSGIRAGSDIKA